MDLASLVGMLGGLVMIVFGIISGDEGVAAMGNFLHLPSFIITFGGSIFGVMASTSMSGFINGLKSLTLTLKAVPEDIDKTIKNIIDLIVNKFYKNKEDNKNRIQNRICFLQGLSKKTHYSNSCINRCNINKNNCTGIMLYKKHNYL